MKVMEAMLDYRVASKPEVRCLMSEVKSDSLGTLLAD